ncbi:MAG TPA: Uma2 family endonuclease [Thermomicrobiales bacterium]|nr:Uma2 family endonuclease [Thermomicrobiales bacterium]
MAIRVLPREAVLRSTDATWTAAEWEQLPDDGHRYEIIEGVLYMATAPSFFHQWIALEVYSALRRQLLEPGLAVVVTAPIGLFMPGCDPVQPDVLVVRQDDRGIIRDRRVHGVPALLVEVLSPSNEEQDLVVKRAAYARARVPEYWVARPAGRDILVHSEPESATGQYLQVAHVPPGGELISPTLPFRATIAAFFAGAPDTTL